MRIRANSCRAKIADVIGGAVFVRARSETTVLLDVGAAADANSVTPLMDAFAKEKFNRAEFATPRVPFEADPAGKKDAPLTIDVVHPNQEFRLRTRGPVCPSGPHGSFRMGTTDCAGGDALKNANRAEATGPRSVTVRVAAVAPCGHPTEVMVAVEDAGFA